MIEVNQVYIGVAEGYRNAELRILKDISNRSKFPKPDTFIAEYVNEEIPFAISGESIRTNFTPKLK